MSKNTEYVLFHPCHMCTYEGCPLSVILILQCARNLDAFSFIGKGEAQVISNLAALQLNHEEDTPETQGEPWIAKRGTRGNIFEPVSRTQFLAKHLPRT